MSSLYVIEIGPDRIKVGQSADPKSRLATHRGMAAAHGSKAGREWMSPPQTGTLACERKLIEWCADRATARFGMEYFTGVPFTPAVRFAAELTKSGATIEDLAEVEQALDQVGPFDADELRQVFAARIAAVSTGRPRRLACQPQEVADWLSVPLSWVEDLITSRRIPVRRLGRKVLISAAGLDAFLADMAATS